MKNRILFLNENPLPRIFTKGTISGKELRLRAACESIDEVHVIALPGQAVETQDTTIGALEKKIVVHQTISWPYYLAPIILFIYGLVFGLRLKPKLIEAESPILSGAAAVLIGKLLRIPVLVEVRASYDQLIKMKLMWLPLQLKKVGLSWVQTWVFKRASVIVVNSKAYQQQVKQMGFESVIINPGLQYPPKITSKQSAAKVIGFLGRLVPEKGVDYLLKACKLIEADLVEQGWSVEIAGDGPERARLERLADRLFRKSKLKVSFSGWVNNYQALSRFGLLVNPCLVRHPLEMVNIEAAYMHVPVVCFGNSQIPETVMDGVTGTKVKRVSAKALALGIKLRRRYNFDDRFLLNYSFKRQAAIYAQTIKLLSV